MKLTEYDQELVWDLVWGCRARQNDAAEKLNRKYSHLKKEFKADFWNAVTELKDKFSKSRE